MNLLKGCVAIKVTGMAVDRYHIHMQDLCVGCGACIALCPYSAISIELYKGVARPRFNLKHCRFCGLCVKVCPVLLHLNEDKYSVEHVIGKIYSVFFACSTDIDLRYYGASGGVVTSLLQFMLKQRIVDAVLVIKMGNFIPRPLLTGHIEEVLAAQGSVYFKTFSLIILRKIIGLLKAGKRLCIVALPCQVYTLKRILKNYSDKLYFIALICYSTNEPWYLQHFISAYTPRNCTPIAVSPRNRGWPGTIRILIKDTKVNEISVPQTRFWRGLALLRLSAPLGCLLCSLHLAPDADIVVGDAWHPKYMGKDPIGHSIVIVRSLKGLKVINDAINCKVIEIDKATFYDMTLTCMHHIIEGAYYANVRRNFISKYSIASKPNNVAMIALLILNRLCKSHKWLRTFLSLSPILRILKLIIDVQYSIGKKYIINELRKVLHYGRYNEASYRYQSTN